MKKRVLLIASGGLDKSGVPSVIMTIVRELQANYSFDILLSGPAGGYYEEEFRRLGGRIFRREKKRFRWGLLNTLADFLRPLSLFAYTLRLLRTGGPYDGIHCHNEFDMAGCLAAAARRGVPVRVAHVHRTWQGQGGLLTRLSRCHCRKVINACATARLGCSRQANEAFYGPDAAPRLILNPYDERRFVFDAGKAQQGGPLRIAQIGYLCENKNQLFTLGVFRLLHDTRPDARLCFVGAAQGDYGRVLQAAIQEAGLTDLVTLLPEDTDIPALLNESTLLLLPSRAEGFGIVLIEAQAMGLPCYASDTVPREADRGGVHFLPLSSGAQAWADAILRERRFEQRELCDCSGFSIGVFSDRIRQVYQASGIDSNQSCYRVKGADRYV